MLVAAVALVSAHLFDLVTFLIMTAKHGLAAEANPIVVLLAQELGLPGLTLAKVASVGIGIGVFALLAPERRRLAMGVLLFGVAAGIVGGVSNVATL